MKLCRRRGFPNDSSQEFVEGGPMRLFVPHGTECCVEPEKLACLRTLLVKNRGRQFSHCSVCGSFVNMLLKPYCSVHFITDEFNHLKI